MKGSESKADEQAEQQQFMLLDSYLERLQSGDAPSRAVADEAVTA